MADIRINALATTATSSASDDYVAIDGSANGTRKLSAYSPTFGGNLTVNGNAATVASTGASAELVLKRPSTSYGSQISFNNGSTNEWFMGSMGGGSQDFRLYNNVAGNTAIQFNSSTSTATLAGNLNARSALGYATGIHSGTTSDSTQQLLLTSNAAYNHAYFTKNGTNLGIGFSSSNGSFTEDNAITIAAATKLVTLAGDLTVSGTGTSSVAGSLYVGSSTQTGAVRMSLDGLGTAGNVPAIRFQSAGVTKGYVGLSGSLLGTTATDMLVGTDHATGGVIFMVGDTGLIAGKFTSGGNFLLGTTTDSSNGKLQLATHTTSAGGIGFGTDTSLYRTGTGSLALDGGTLPILRFFNGASQYGYVYAGSADGELACVTGPLRLKSANTTALTLDSSQNATFAGNITAGSSTSIQQELRTATSNASRLISAFDTDRWYINSTYSGTGTAYKLEFLTGNLVAVSIDTSQNTTLSGKLIVSNSQTPASASATGTTGTIAWDASYIYICTAANTWKRVAIATW